MAFRGSSRSIFTSSTTETLLFNILEMQVKILFEKRHLLLKEATEDRGSNPAVLHESLQQAVIHLLLRPL